MARISETEIVGRDDSFFGEVLAFYKKGLAANGVDAHLVYDRDCISPDRMIVCIVGNKFANFSDLVFVLYDSANISEKSKSIIDDHSYFERMITGDGGIVYGVNYIFTYGIDDGDLVILKQRLETYLSENTDFFKPMSCRVTKSYHRDIVKFKKNWKENIML